MRYEVQTSTNLTDWILLDTVTITNLNGNALISNPGRAGLRHPILPCHAALIPGPRSQA